MQSRLSAAVQLYTINICTELVDASCVCLHYVAYIVLFDVKLLFINMLIMVELKNGCCVELLCVVVHTDHCYVLFRCCI